MGLATSDADIDFTKPWNKSDVTFVVDKKKLYFNRAVLAFHSDVFDRMFNSEFRESDAQKHIELPEKKFEDVQAMLFVLKSRPANFPNAITNTNLHALLAMSDEYHMQQLVVECEKFILTNWKSDATKHVEAVKLAFKYSMQAVAEAFLLLAACRRLDEIDGAAAFLPDEVYAALLHGHLRRCQGAPVRKVYYLQKTNPKTNASQYDAVYVMEVQSCACGRLKFDASSQCECVGNAPANDPKIKEVLANFAKISLKMK